MGKGVQAGCAGGGVWGPRVGGWSGEGAHYHAGEEDVCEAGRDVPSWRHTWRRKMMAYDQARQFCPLPYP